MNQTSKHIHNNKEELLRVLGRPEIPLHTNGSETGLRDHVKNGRSVGGACSDEERRCRDAFSRLKRTCRKLGISIREYLVDRLGIGEQSISPQPEIIFERATIATGY